MPKKKNELKQKPMHEYTDDRSCLNGVPFEGRLPQEALDEIRKRLSKRVGELLSMPGFEKDREVIIRKYGKKKDEPPKE